MKIPASPEALFEQIGSELLGEGADGLGPLARKCLTYLFTELVKENLRDEDMSETLMALLVAWRDLNNNYGEDLSRNPTDNLEDRMIDLVYCSRLDQQLFSVVSDINHVNMLLKHRQKLVGGSSTYYLDDD